MSENASGPRRPRARHRASLADRLPSPGHLWHDVEQACRRVAGRAESLFRRRRRPRRQTPPPVGHRPDGSIVPAPQTLVVVKAKHTGPVGTLTSPFRQAGAAVATRWHDAMREGKLAAREKEAEIRANYERRVQHDPRWHAQQHNRSKRG